MPQARGSAVVTERGTGMRRTQALALGLATALAFEGCASRLPRKPPSFLSNMVNGIAVHADPIFTMASGDEVVFAEITRVTVRLENLDKRYAGARSVDIAIDFPDGSRFPAMRPAVVQEQVNAQRERWTADLQEPPVQPPPDSTMAARDKEKIATGLLAAACLPAYVGQLFPPLMLLTAPVCLGTLAIVHPMLPKQPKPPSDAERRRLRLNDDLHTLRVVELVRGETATALLHFPIASDIVRDAPGATLTVPFVDVYERDLVVVRVPLTTDRS